MNLLVPLFLALLILISTPESLLAAVETPKQPQWWEVVGGILAIPAALVGIAYSYILIRKTRLEARKTELEILEKEKQLQLVAAQPGAVREIIAPIAETRYAQSMLLRFALLYVTLRLWDLVTSVFPFVMGGALLGLQQVKAISFDDNSFYNKLIIIFYYVLSNVPKIVDWVIVLGIGWPLFRDLNALLGIDIKSILLPWHNRRIDSPGE